MENLKEKIQEEGNEKTFLYKNFECRIIRHKTTMFLLGYVKIPQTSIYYGRDIDDSLVSRLCVHGGITFAGKRFDDKCWWLGFDCGHYGDLMPYLNFTLSGHEIGIYRDMEYVTEELKKLVNQLKK